MRGSGNKSNHDGRSGVEQISRHYFFLHLENYLAMRKCSVVQFPLPPPPSPLKCFVSFISFRMLRINLPSHFVR